VSRLGLLPCLHCGHPFSKHDTTILVKRGWRVHPDCDVRIGEGHQSAGCMTCFQERRDGQTEG
jgi:hypothetical protein